MSRSLLKTWDDYVGVSKDHRYQSDNKFCGVTIRFERLKSEVVMHKRKAKQIRRLRDRRVQLQMVNNQPQPCGECQECCMAVGVHEFEKPMWTNCKHQCETGCGIYDTRPASCQSYYCLYQSGFFGEGEELRPDLCRMWHCNSPTDRSSTPLWALAIIKLCRMWHLAADLAPTGRSLPSVA